MLGLSDSTAHVLKLPSLLFCKKKIVGNAELRNVREVRQRLGRSCSLLCQGVQGPEPRNTLLEARSSLCRGDTSMEMGTRGTGGWKVLTSVWGQSLVLDSLMSSLLGTDVLGPCSPPLTVSWPAHLQPQIKENRRSQGWSSPSQRLLFSLLSISPCYWFIPSRFSFHLLGFFISREFGTVKSHLYHPSLLRLSPVLPCLIFQEAVGVVSLCVWNLLPGSPCPWFFKMHTLWW